VRIAVALEVDPAELVKGLHPSPKVMGETRTGGRRGLVMRPSPRSR
jgi:hypothetical protein